MAKASGSTRAKTSRTASSSGGGSKYLQGKTFSASSFDHILHQDNMVEALHAYGQSHGYETGSLNISKDLDEPGYKGNVTGYLIKVDTDYYDDGSVQLSYTSQITGHKSARYGSAPMGNEKRSFTTIEAAERYIKKKVKEHNKK